MNVLMIAYFFPPDASSGAFRPMFFARDLQAAGHQVTVLTVREEDFFPYQNKDDRLIETVNNGVQVIRAPLYDLHRQLIALKQRLKGRPAPAQPLAVSQPVGISTPSSPPQKSRFQDFKDLITDVMAIPDQYNGWIRPAVKAGAAAIRDQRLDVIYATGNPWSSLLAGVKLKQLTGKPLVVDFRDPWVGQPNYFAKRPYCQRQEDKLERRVLERADHVIANTPELKADLQRRYPFLDEPRISAITNGFEDFLPRGDVDPSVLTITHAGTLNLRNPKFLLQAAIRLIEQGVIPAHKLRLAMLGGIEVPDPELPGVLAHPLLQDVVRILPRMPYRDAMTVQQRSDVLLLLQPHDFPLQIPRKLYEYLAFRKPILGIAAAESATARMIRQHQLGVVVKDEPAAIAGALETLYRQWEHGSLEVPAAQAEQFRNQNLSRRLEAVLQSAITARPPS